jgi:hypothetical protein
MTHALIDEARQPFREEAEALAYKIPGCHTMHVTQPARGLLSDRGAISYSERRILIESRTCRQIPHLWRGPSGLDHMLNGEQNGGSARGLDAEVVSSQADRACSGRTTRWFLYP